MYVFIIIFRKLYFSTGSCIRWYSRDWIDLGDVRTRQGSGWSCCGGSKVKWWPTLRSKGQRWSWPLWPQQNLCWISHCKFRPNVQNAIFHTNTPTQWVFKSYLYTAYTLASVRTHDNFLSLKHDAIVYTELCKTLDRPCMLLYIVHKYINGP